jgi:exodeoxyribonuclease V beta subunit
MARLHQGLQRVGWLYPEKESPEQKEELREARAELIRLLYVGLTRARLATWVGWGAVKKANETALGWLLHRVPGSEDVNKLDADAVSERLQQFRQRAGDAVAVQAAVSPSVLESLPRLHFNDGIAPPPVRVARRKLDRDWWVYSFSQLAREDSGAEAGGAWDEIEGAPLPRSRFSGSRFGNVLHQALEKIDFNAWLDWRDELPPTGQMPALQQALSDHGYASEADQFEGLPLLTALVSETLNTAMPEGVRLAALGEPARRAEMEFHLSLAPVQVSAMLDLLHRHGVVDARKTFGKRHGLEGLLTGRIDLIYEAQSRYYVLDYKSNQLPDYGPESVSRAIAEGEYDLQYLIYTLALHRWLRFRLGAAYDIGEHLGGVRYLFCRGLDRDDAARPGVHALRLPDALILELDALFEIAGAPA